MAANDKVAVTRSKLDALANALKTIFGFTGKKTLDELVEEAGHYDPRPDISDATATAAQILSPYTAYINGGKTTGTMQSLDAQTYAPSTKRQTIAAGKYLAGAQTIRAMNLQNKTVAASSQDTTVYADSTYDALNSVTVSGISYPVIAFRTFTTSDMTSDRRGLVLTEDESAQYLKSAPTCILVYTTSALSSAGVVFVLSTLDFSAYKIATGSGSQAATGAYITPVFNASGKGLLQLTDTVGDTFAEASYTVLVLGGGVWT